MRTAGASRPMRPVRRETAPSARSALYMIAHVAPNTITSPATIHTLKSHDRVPTIAS